LRVFPDTNVLASAFGTRGLCADVLRIVVAEHELLSGEVVIDELRSVLRRKFGVPADTIQEIESFIRGFPVEARPVRLPNLKLSERSDLMVVASVINAGAEILITGDHEMLALKPQPKGMRIVNPREFWNLTSRQAGRGRP
jgi:uncharacterized protein